MSRLNHHPQLRERMETLLNVVENVAGDWTKADAAEQFVMDELRKLGNAALQCWAEQAVQKATATVRQQQPALPGNGKKSLVAYDFRGPRGHRTGLAWPGSPGETFSYVGRGDRPELFPAVATRHDRLRR